MNPTSQKLAVHSGKTEGSVHKYMAEENLAIFCFQCATAFD